MSDTTSSSTSSDHQQMDFTEQAELILLKRFKGGDSEEEKFRVYTKRIKDWEKLIKDISDKESELQSQCRLYRFRTQRAEQDDVIKEEKKKLEEELADVKDLWKLVEESLEEDKVTRRKLCLNMDHLLHETDSYDIDGAEE